MYVGEYLKKARVKRKITLTNVAEELKISIGYLEAIENDEFSKTPGGVYLLGFIRTYADYLKLNSDQIINEYKIQMSIFETPKPIKTPKPLEAFHFFPFTRMASLSVIVIISVFFYFMFIDESNIQQDYAITSNVPEVSESIIEEYEVVTALSKIKEINKDIVIKQNNISELELLNNNTVTNQNNQLNALASKPTNSDEKEMKNLISLKALNSTWIQLRNSDDMIVYSKLMDKNDVYSYSLNDNYVITTGNAGNIVVSINNEVMGKLGKKGEVLDSISILPDYFSN